MVESFDGLSEKEATERVKRLKILLQKREDFKQLSKILFEFTRAWKERKGRLAEVVSAEPLSDKVRENMEKSLIPPCFAAYLGSFLGFLLSKNRLQRARQRSVKITPNYS